MTTKKARSKVAVAVKKAKTVSPAKPKRALAKAARAAAKSAPKGAAAKKPMPAKRPLPAKKPAPVHAKKPAPKAKPEPKKTAAPKKAPEKKLIAKKPEVPSKAPEKLNGQFPKKPEVKAVAKPVPAKPQTAKPGQGNGRAGAPLRHSMTMASTPVRPPVVAVPGQPAIVVKPAPSAPLLGGPRPSASGESAKLATLIRASGFATGDHVVYPTHGVGRIVETETQIIAGQELHLFVITFEKNRMTLRLPIAKVRTSGLRKLATRKEMLAALTRLKGRSRARRTMWSRRAQEYEAKINSGDPNSIAEVVRDLYRNAGQPDQSYSERQIYQEALDRLASEFAVIEKIDEQTAAQRLEQMLRAA